MRVERTDPTASTPFAARMSVEQVEEGLALAPKFDANCDGSPVSLPIDQSDITPGAWRTLY